MNLAKLIEFEGSVPHYYLDTKGIPTIGVGHAVTSLDAALAINGWDKPELAVGDYHGVRTGPMGHRADYYAQYCRSRLSDAGIQSLLILDVDRELGRLRKTVDAIDRYQQPVRDALADMAFNLGGSFLNVRKPDGSLMWSKFLHAVVRGDFATCAAECWRAGISEARNEWTRLQFLAGVAR